jgi:hypothetical protein
MKIAIASSFVPLVHGGGRFIVDWFWALVALLFWTFLEVTLLSNYGEVNRPPQRLWRSRDHICGTCIATPRARARSGSRHNRQA